MMKEHEEARFRELSRDLTEDIRVRRMSQYIQHGSTTTYDHVLRVARTAYRLNHILHLKADDYSLIRASILHDYYLYDWHQRGDRLHGYHHARIAADNALRDFAISPAEQAMIRSHMWPLNLFSIPLSRGGWLLTIADKIASAQETVMDRIRPSASPC